MRPCTPLGCSPDRSSLRQGPAFPILPGFDQVAQRHQGSLRLRFAATRSCIPSPEPRFGSMSGYNLTHLQQLEAESIHIIREVAAEFENPAKASSTVKILESIRETTTPKATISTRSHSVINRRMAVPNNTSVIHMLVSIRENFTTASSAQIISSILLLK